jgi:hypothetical protein
MSLGQLTGYSRIARYRDPPDRLWMQGLRARFAERARIPDYANSPELHYEDRDQISSYIAGGVLVQQRCESCFRM